MSASRSRPRSEPSDATDPTETSDPAGAAMRAAVPMMGTGAGPKPDPTTFAGTTSEPDGERRRTTTRSTDDTAAE